MGAKRDASSEILCRSTPLGPIGDRVCTPACGRTSLFWNWNSCLKCFMKASLPVHSDLSLLCSDSPKWPATMSSDAITLYIIKTISDQNLICSQEDGNNRKILFTFFTFYHFIHSLLLRELHHYFWRTCLFWGDEWSEILTSFIPRDLFLVKTINVL